MKRKGAPAKDGKCPRDAPKDQKCGNCRSKKGACQFAERIAAANATLSPGEPSTSERPRPQAAADSDMDDAEPRPARERKAPERWQCDANITSRAAGTRRLDSCCSCSEPTTPDESAAPKPKFTGPMDKYLSDIRVEAAVNRAVKSITDNPADLERELRDFAQTGEDWRQKSMTLEQENEAIRKNQPILENLEALKRGSLTSPAPLLVVLGTWGATTLHLACVDFLNPLLAITCRVMGRGLSWHEFPDIARRAKRRGIPRTQDRDAPGQRRQEMNTCVETRADALVARVNH
jgi:hypothetical protein